MYAIAGPEDNHHSGGYGCAMVPRFHPSPLYEGRTSRASPSPFGRATAGNVLPCPSPHHPAFKPSPRHPAAFQPSAPPMPPQGMGFHPSPHAGIGYPAAYSIPPSSPMHGYPIPPSSPMHGYPIPASPCNYYTGGVRYFSGTLHVRQVEEHPPAAAQPSYKRRRSPWLCGSCCDVEVA